MRRIRCAIYTRKSSEEGLEQEFNSLDAQREACEAYVASQKHEGWELVSTRYDDGGISGGHLDRPGLQRLMQDVDDRKIDQIVVYKIDRLTRSLADFARLVDRLDAAQASFVSVTQSFNTGTSMGRLTLNVLLSFAQFEREVTAERIRDKIAASKRKGLWMGGTVPLGYDADGRTLKVNPDEAKAIATIYDLYETHLALNKVTEEAARCGIRSRKRQTRSGGWRGGHILSRGHIHYILTSPIYAGRIPHKGKTYDGQHPAIIDPDRWDRVQKMLSTKAPRPVDAITRKTGTSPLLGKLYDQDGERLSPSHTRKGDRRYRYYISRQYVTGRKDQLKGRGWRLPAEQLEQAVAQGLRNHLRGVASQLIHSDATLETLQKLHELKDRPQEQLFDLLARVGLENGSMAVELHADRLADLLHCKREELRPEKLEFGLPFVQKRRGVETRLIINGQSSQIDQTLVDNIAQSHEWLKQVQRGETIDAIARANGTTKKRVQQTLEFAFLAPDIVRDVLAGQQPAGLTSTWVATHSIPSDWAAQRQLIAAL